MKILLINYEYPPVGGGAANATWELARAFVQLGHAPVVLTARWGDRVRDESNPGVRVIEVPALRRSEDRCTMFEMATFVASATPRIRRLLRREAIDGVIAFFSIPCGPIAWWGWRGTKIPYVVSLRGGDVPGNEPSLAAMHHRLRPLRHAVLRHARAIVANSAGLKAAAEAADPFPVDVIFNGVDTDYWHPPASRPPPAPFRFLFVGRLQAQKNVGWLLERLAELELHEATTAWTLDIVGDGPLRTELQTLAERLALATRVTWHGWLGREALRARYQQSHALINPSLYEGMPNVVLEAMSCGLPVIASDVAGNQTLVEPGKTGALFDSGDTAAFRRQSASWLRNPPLQLGETARAVTLSSFAWKRVASNYADALASGPAPRSTRSLDELAEPFCGRPAQ